MAIVSAGVLAVVKLHIDHRSASEENATLDDAVFGGQFQAVNSGMRFYRRLTILGRNILVTRLCPLQNTVFKSEGRNDSMPERRAVRAFEVVGEEQLFFDRDGPIGDSGAIDGEDRRCQKSENRGGKNCFHGGGGWIMRLDLGEVFWEVYWTGLEQARWRMSGSGGKVLARRVDDEVCFLVIGRANAHHSPGLRNYAEGALSSGVSTILVELRDC